MLDRRVSRTAAEHGIRTTTVYTDPDAQSAHVRASPFSHNLGPAAAYLDVEKVISAAKLNGCDAVHPGYGFLSENSHFATRCGEEGITFIGPPPSAMESMGNKSESKTIMTAAGVPCVPGYHGANQDAAFLLAEANRIGFPVLVKAVKGGGGKGMRIARTAADFPGQLASAQSEAQQSFGDPVVLIERYITTPRHIEVQVFSDAHGNTVALGERDCSVQRRHQKIIEESPAPFLDDATRKDIWKKARDAATAVGYRGAGTVEFIFDNDTGEFFFMEMNTRLQVEHPVTEMVTGVDLVHWQLLVAAGQPLPLTQDQIEERLNGHAFEARIYAENPAKGFIPDSGRLVHVALPPAARVDTGFNAGDEITTFYDPMISKLIVHAPTRSSALAKLRAALEQYQIVGPATNISFLKTLCNSPDFVAGKVETGYIEKHPELFTPLETPSEVFAQAALSLLLAETAAEPFAQLGFTGGSIGARTLRLAVAEESVEVTVVPHSPTNYTIITPDATYPVAITSHTDTTITAHYPHTLLTSTIIRHGSSLDVFQRGEHYKLAIPEEAWVGEAKGVEEVQGGVKSPMPCKVLRVCVKQGDEVVKGQELVVVESMKMEMVVRAERAGVVDRVVHAEGEVVGAGVALVTFKEEEESL